MAVPIQQFIGRNKRSFLIGGIVLVVLAFLIIQRSQSAAGQTAAFHVSEAGLHYALHLFNTGTCMPQELADTTLVQIVPALPLTGQAAEPARSVGAFAVSVDSLPTKPATHWQVTARGRLAGQMGACQEIVADVESFSGVLGTKYRIASWESHGATWCVEATPTVDVTCEGQK